MDSNARSTTWYDAITNRRGRILEEFLISNRLNIANEDSALTTFEFTRGTSNVDLLVQWLNYCTRGSATSRKAFLTTGILLSELKNIRFYFMTTTTTE